MKKTLTLLTAGLVLGGALVATKPASATPSTLGFYPSTDVYGDGVFHYDADSYSKNGTRNFFSTNGLTYGIGNKFEFGADYVISNQGAKFGDNISGHFKYKFLDGGAEGVSAAAGAWGLGRKSFGYPNVGYVNASKNFSFGRITAGVASSFGDENVLGDDDTSLTLGFDRYLTPKLQFAVDYYSGKNTYAGIQPTLYYYINDKANFGLGYMKYNRSALEDQVYVCFDYNFDFKQTEPEVVAPAPAPETVTGEAKN